MTTPMSDTSPLYNSRILKIFMEFLQSDYPHISQDAVFEKSGIEKYKINDPAHWLTQEEVDRFYAVVCGQTGEPDVARRAGRFASSKGLGTAKQYMLGLMTPTAMFLFMEKLYPLLSRGADIAVRKIESNTFEITATPKPGVAEQENLLKHTTFQIDNPDSKGFFVLAMRELRPFLVNNISEIEHSFSKKSMEFARQLNGESFICVPIVFEKKSLGILAVDNSKSRADLKQSDMNMLMGIASETAMSIVNAVSFEKIKKSEERYRLLSENITDVILTIDLPGLNFSYVSPSVHLLQGFTPEEFIELTLADILLPHSLKYATDVIAEELAKESAGETNPLRSRILEIEEYCKDGSTVWVEATASFLRDEKGNATGILVVSRNITQRKTAENEKKKLEAKLQQAYKMEAVGTLAGGIAHDFNNILSAVIGYTELGLKEAADRDLPGLKNKFQEILKAGYRARDLVRQILAFSRQAEYKKQPVQIRLVINEALKLLRASIPTTIEIHQNLLSDSLVMGDPTQIHQILMNLCTNAQHAMGETGGILEVSLMDMDINHEFATENPGISPGRHLCLTIRDTGHGMPAELIKRLYDPFFTTKEPGKGTGLGLSVVHGIVKNYGGAITVQSKPGLGSAFNIFLPVIREQIQPGAKINIQAPTGSERILFVDDEKSIMDLGRQVLEQLGYRVEALTSSVDALELFKAGPETFDLIITDMTMPKMTGAKLAQEILAVRPDMPMILCTGFSESINEEKALRIGFKEYIMKPISIDQIARSIRRVLDSRKASTLKQGH
ncbi:MAG: response regulator [Desulfosalsimonadaceae bacterium]